MLVLFLAACSSSAVPAKNEEKDKPESSVSITERIDKENLEKTDEEEPREDSDDLSAMRETLKESKSPAGIIYLGDSSGMTTSSFYQLCADYDKLAVISQIDPENLIYGGGDHYFIIITADPGDSIAIRDIGSDDSFYSRDDGELTAITVNDNEEEVVITTTDGKETVFPLQITDDDIQADDGSFIKNFTIDGYNQPYGNRSLYESTVLKGDEISSLANDGVYYVDWSKTTKVYMDDGTECFNIVFAVADDYKDQYEEKYYAVSVDRENVYVYDESADEWVLRS